MKNESVKSSIDKETIKLNILEMIGKISRQIQDKKSLKDMLAERMMGEIGVNKKHLNNKLRAIINGVVLREQGTHFFGEFVAFAIAEKEFQLKQDNVNEMKKSTDSVNKMTGLVKLNILKNPDYYLNMKKLLKDCYNSGLIKKDVFEKSENVRSRWRKTRNIFKTNSKLFEEINLENFSTLLVENQEKKEEPIFGSDSEVASIDLDGKFYFYYLRIIKELPIIKIPPAPACVIFIFNSYCTPTYKFCIF